MSGDTKSAKQPKTSKGTIKYCSTGLGAEWKYRNDNRWIERDGKRYSGRQKDSKGRTEIEIILSLVIFRGLVQRLGDSVCL